MNADKTQHLVCSLSRRQEDVQAPVKLLGFRIDAKLTWVDHIEQVANRLSRVCFLLPKLRHSVTELYLVMAYHALFHCHVTYGLLLWGQSPRAIDILLLQKRAVRIMTGSQYRATCKQLFSQLGIFTIFGNYIFLCLMHVKENLHLFQTRGDFHPYNTRQCGHLDVPRVRLARSQAEFNSSAVRLFNRLPARTQELDIRSFKSRLSSFIKGREYYAISEYLDDNFADL